MKNIIKTISLICLTCFSFFYTDKVINYLNKNDPLMTEISDLKEEYKIEPVNAIIEEDTIVPGINGKEIDINKSYEEMKLGGIFREELLIYDDIYPINSLANNKDKYIVKGNSIKKRISLIIILNPKEIKKINHNNITIFINHNNINIETLKELKGNEIYTYGNNGIYSDNILINDNSIINNISNNKSIYCLSKNKDNNILKICNKNNMHVIIPNIIGDYNEIKNNISNGSIILLEDINNLNEVIKYINGKGYEIVKLSELLKE